MEPLITERLFGAPSEADRTVLETHLAECGSCATLLREMEQTLSVASRRHREDPGAAYWDGFRGRLDARIEADRATVPLRTVSPRLAHLRSVLGLPALQWAAALVLVAIGVVLGRSVLAPEPQPALVEIPTDGGSEAVIARTQAYLDRSKLLLLELAHFDPETDDPTSLNLTRRSEIARELVHEAADLDVQLAAARERRLRSLVADLEEILTQIAALEAESDAPAIQMLQSGVDQKALMFRIDVEELRAAAGGSAPAGSPPPAGSSL